MNRIDERFTGVKLEWFTRSEHKSTICFNEVGLADIQMEIVFQRGNPVCF
jgi:hypothetical protein